MKYQIFGQIFKRILEKELVIQKSLTINNKNRSEKKKNIVRSSKLISLAISYHVSHICTCIWRKKKPTSPCRPRFVCE